MRKVFIKIIGVLIILSKTFILCSCFNSKEDSITIENLTEVYTVIFDTNGGDKIESLQVEYGTKLEKPILTTKRDNLYDYELKCWQCNGNEWNFEVNKVIKDVTLVAVWEVVGTSKQF